MIIFWAVCDYSKYRKVWALFSAHEQADRVEKDDEGPDLTDLTFRGVVFFRFNETKNALI